ncbi:hypothetical protein PMG11_10505 [Penicillium brasilianum]|uniref:Amine oxidase domain-containing protein n=1 Tax=Penicillium brasilianum TaxID=104259 RepID=A0A0F7TZ70_PENBI|nr:hypothetical protein PMG11_10505 [Penicillium brasilianum]
MPSRGLPRQRVAVIGSGMAGLVTAYLLRSDASRFEVELFERQDKVSLDSASLTIPTDHGNFSKEHRVDLPMRAFADGYYTYLRRMYDYFGVRYASPRFIYTLSSIRGVANTKINPYFIHSSNNHRVPPLRPESLSLGFWLLELVYLAICYYWFTACCFLIRPKTAEGTGREENFRQYVERIKLPRYYVKNYLLPLLSSVTTCPHDMLLNFPAVDLVEYERKTFRQPHYTIVGGVRTIQESLTKGQKVRFLSTVTAVQNVGSNVRVTWRDEQSGHSSSALFDHVIMAVTPDVVGSIFLPLREAMGSVPTMKVPTVVHLDSIRLDDCNKSLRARISRDREGRASQPIHMCSNTNATESTHEHPSSVLITTSPIIPINQDKILHSVTFTRVLRTPESRHLLRHILDSQEVAYSTGKASSGWQNGNGNVWLVGGWCWDGMVMLEGCVFSAMRVAERLGVNVPWGN